MFVTLEKTREAAWWVEMPKFGFLCSDAVLSTPFTRVKERMQEEGKPNVSRISFDRLQITYVFM